MRCKFAFAPVVLFASLTAIGQQAAPAVSPATAGGQTVRYAGPDIVAPEMLPPDVSVSFPEHCSGLNGVVRLSAVVDAKGVPHDIKVLSSDDSRLSNLAIGLADALQFKAGTENGAAVPVAIELTFGLHTCAQSAKAVGDEKLIMRAHPLIAMRVSPPPSVPEGVNIGSPSGSTAVSNNTQPPYKVGANISPPVALHEIEAEYSDYGLKNRITGICLVGLIVDATGMPRNIHLIKGLEPSLDDKALDAVRQFRFKPALKDGTTPVPVEMTIEVNFILRK
jgi:TonB family protein